MIDAWADERALIVFYHGGGFVGGNLDSHDAFCVYLADQMDMPVLSVDYRLAPEHPFPAALDDAEAVTRWAAESPALLGFGVTGLITCGDSAGGNLALVVGQQLALRPRHGASARAVGALPARIGGLGLAFDA